jgi:phosphoserine phosphatase RsbU/P
VGGAEVTPADVGRLLRADALNVALGVVLMAVGLLAATIHARARRRETSALRWFALFAFLYGLRLLARTTTVPLVFEQGPRPWQYLAATITYVIPIPGVLLLRAFLPRPGRLLAWAGALLAVFALGAIASDVVRQSPDSARIPNDVIAIAFLAVGLVLLFLPDGTASRDRTTLRIGLVAVALTAAADNLRGLGLLSGPSFDLEPIGTTILVACVGAIAARRVRKDAERLLAMDKELSIARGIQASILPRAMPRVAGLTVAARYHPMTAVAGDFYEFLEVGERRLGILVADVSGHGVPAALIASMVKIAIAAQRPNADRPAAVLAGMNETLAGQLGGQYVTAAYLFLDAQTRVMRYGAAGHPPLLRWRRGEPRGDELLENGFPLGMMDRAEYTQLEQPLRPGDRFLLYTDGLVEAANAAGEFYTLERVKDTVAAAALLPTESGADLIVAGTRGWARDVADDDLTVVLVDCA